MSEKLKELKILLLMIAIFVGAYFIPFTSTRFLNGLHEGLLQALMPLRIGLLGLYDQDHVRV